MNALQLVPKPITVTTTVTARMIVSAGPRLSSIARQAALFHAQDVEAACLSMLKAGVPYTELEILQSRGQDISFDGDIAVTIVRSRA